MERAHTSALFASALTLLFAAPSLAVPCSYSYHPASASFGAGGGTGSFEMTVGPLLCTPIAPEISDDWFHIVSVTGHASPYTVAYAVDPNPSCASRSAALSQGSATFKVSQAGATATPGLVPSYADVGNAGGSGSFAVYVAAGCSWSAVADDAFITLSPPTSGIGEGSVSYQVAAQGGCLHRTGTITVSSGSHAAAFTVNQDGTPAVGVLSPPDLSVGSESGSASIGVAVPAGCPWSATSSSPWLAFPQQPRSPAPLGNGPGSVSVSWGQNTSHDSRTGSATIANSPFTVVQAGNKTGCAPDSATLCLLGNRFAVTARYRDYAGHEGDGRAVGLTPDTGYFWFFTPANVEAVVKMVDFCSGGNPVVAVYGTGLTDLGVTAVVSDLSSGTARTYTNVLGTPFRLIRDGPFPCVSPAASGGLGAPAIPLAASAPEEALPAIFSYAAAGSCTPDATSLCLVDGRFRVRAAWQDYGGGSGQGQAVALTSDTGYFWFFTPANVEVVAKIVSFCGSTPARWAVYANGLTDLGVALSVTDTRSGLTATYPNPLGRPFELIRDAPFACP